MAVLGLYLFVMCPKCGKKYKFPAEKLKRRKLVFSCSSCTAQIRITRPDILEPPAARPSEDVLPTPGKQESAVGSPLETNGVPIKASLLFFFTFLLVILGLIFLADSRMKSLQSKSLKAGNEIVEFITKKMVVQFTEAMAKQASYYLLSHPYLRKEDFNTDLYFKKAVLQKVGVSGTTWLYERGKEENDWKIWVDYDPSQIGRSMKAMDKYLGQYFLQYWNIVTRVEPTEGVSGISKWPDSNGIVRDRFIAATPVEGTPFVVGASIFMDEIRIPFERIETKGFETVRETTLLLLSVAVIGLVLLFIIGFVALRSTVVKN